MYALQVYNSMLMTAVSSSQQHLASTPHAAVISRANGVPIV